MKRCPVGAIVTHDELKVLAGALDLACQDVEENIRDEVFFTRIASERLQGRPARVPRSAAARLKSLRDSLSIYRRALKNVERVRTAKR
jgi:hypothetical protein